MNEREDQDKNPVDREMIIYYSRDFAEAERLSLGHCQIEYERTLDILDRLLPTPPALVLDVGGAAGAYSVWLLRRGYEVHLIDPVPLHIDQANGAFSKLTVVSEYQTTVGHAGELDQDDASADVVLLMGPLYHLTDGRDRLAALREARRVLKPSGLLLAVGISRFASLLDGLATGCLKDPAFRDIVDRDLREGQHRNPTDHPEYFTRTFFHHPAELEREVRDAGFCFEKLIGVDGPGLPNDVAAFLEGGRLRHSYFEFLRRVESEPTLIGASPHIMAVARK
jgi:ubiquinone/menaquinone biosynthesis C-methylase UbiE